MDEMKTETKEAWRDVPEYEGLYQVSNLGNIKSLQKGSRIGITQYLLLNIGSSCLGYLKIKLCGAEII